MRAYTIDEKLFEEVIKTKIIKDVPKIVYHGSNHKFDLKTLKISRNEIEDIKYRRTGSSESGNGFYVTKHLWMNGPENAYIFNPFYKEDLNGYQSAEKYANFKFEQTKIAYIYEITLADDIKIITEQSLHNIGEEKFKQALEKGVDGYADSSYDIREMVIFNKNKIKSIKIVFYAKAYAPEVSLLTAEKRKDIKSWTRKVMPPEYVKNYMEKYLGKIYRKVDDRTYVEGKKNELENPKIVIINGSTVPNWKKLK